jgi:hypothetical protein
LKASLEDQVNKAATTKVCLVNPDLRSEDILTGGGGTVTEAIRAQLVESRNL